MKLRLSKKINLLHVLITCYFVILLIAGKSFTKYQVAGSLYLHDACLIGLLLVTILFRQKIKIQFAAVALLIFISFIYLIISIFHYKGNSTLLTMVIRQYGLFFYLLCSYLIFCFAVKTESDAFRAIDLLKLIGNLSFVTQVVYLMYGFIFIPNFSLFNPSDYPYFSPLVVLGVITFCADALSLKRTAFNKTARFSAGLLLTLTFGHSSAFLAVFVILMLFAYIKIKPIQRIFSLVFIIIAILLLLFLPQFTDDNASWRLLYWNHIIERSYSDGYLILGHGFGEAYMTSEYAQFIFNSLNSSVMMDQLYPMARHLNPPHNSILTMVFHIGLIATLLFFLPLRYYFNYLFFKKINDDNSLFLILGLSGSLIWICFNVILELPHSASYFWLIYFTTAFYLKRMHLKKRL